jgi:hypothetical protein
MASRNRPQRAGVRGKSEKTHYASGLTEIVSETVRLWRKHHLGYDQTKYVVEQARRRLKLQSPGTRRRTVNRLDKSEVERLIRSTYQSHNKYGLMFYLSVLDDTVRLPEEQPSIGIILCKSKDRLIVEYALKDATLPI